MTNLTPDEASAYKCPVARTFNEKRSGFCDGPDCILWRWKAKPFAGPEFDAAVRKAVENFVGQPGSRQKAAAAVRENPEKYGFDTTLTHGTCGLGGPA